MPRPYNSEKRKQQQEELRQRIIEATVILHAKKGAASTTYKDIAKKADVAIPSVYKHFPDMHSLFTACTGHAASFAPMPSLESLAALPKLRQRITALVEMRCKVNEYFHPWLKWGGDRVVPEFISLMKHDSQATKKLINVALSLTHKDKEPPKQTISIILLLLKYHSWACLAIEQDLPQKQVEKYLTDAICRIVEC